VSELVLRGFFIAQGAYGTLLGRAHSEPGASTVQFALLVALGALVVAVLVGALGAGVKDLFGGTHRCLSGLTTTACKVTPVLRGTTQAK